MGFRFRRSVKVLPGIRLNFGKRGISTSIGVRGAHVTFGGTGTRATVGLPGTGLSYTHLERPHRALTATAQPSSDPGVSQGSAQRGFLWIGLIVVALVVALGRLTAPDPPAQIPAPARGPAEIPAQTTHGERLAELKAAARGLTEIRRSVANSNTLSLRRVSVLPSGTICYQFQLRNSRGVTYVRTAMTEGGELRISGADGYAALWNHRCALKAGRDITAQVQALPAPQPGSPAIAVLP